jgi:hypothetical protein
MLTVVCAAIVVSSCRHCEECFASIPSAERVLDGAVVVGLLVVCGTQSSK